MLVGGCYRFAAMMTIKQGNDKPELKRPRFMQV
jgi:hypothetical protein